MNLDLSRLSGQEPDTAVPLTVRPARHPSELAAYAALLAANWEPPDTCVTQAYAGAEAALLTPRCPLRFVVGYATAKRCAARNFAWAPAPWPEYTVWSRPPDIGGKVLLPVCYGRRRGPSRAAGFTHATLQASEDGLHLYRRMGFQPYGDWVEYCGRLLPAKG